LGGIKYEDEIRQLNIIDDILFRKMAEDKIFCEEMLRVIMDDKELIVLESTPQWTGNNLKGRSVITDVKCVLSNGRHIGIEVQKSDNDNHQKRVRYNGAVLTTNVTDTGINFEEIPDVCIIYISTFDIFKGNSPIYHIDRIIRETNELANNGFMEIYVNTKVDDGSDVAKLMKVFSQTNEYSDKFPVASEKKRFFRTQNKEVENMSMVLQELIEKERADAAKVAVLEGRKEGIKENSFIVAKNMKCDGMPIDMIIKYTGLSKEDLNSL